MAQARTQEGPAGSALVSISFADLPGWRADDHAAAFAAFASTCAALTAGEPLLRPGLPGSDPLLRVCARALVARPASADDARVFFERHFEAWRIDPPGGTAGFLTGYYEPEIPGSLVRTPEFSVPALGRPRDLISLRPGGAEGLDPQLQGGRRLPSGAIAPFPDRAAIEDGALDGQGLELLWLPDRVELFLAQVQGSARIRLPDGHVARLVYAGRNGHPYTSIGRIIVDEGHMALQELTLARMKAWLRTHPAEARRIMRLNRSYIFFTVRADLDPSAGPIGAASVPLTPLRSIAIDRALWPYGLPFWIDAELPRPEGGLDSVKRLTVAQDTGSAIVGPARIDLFFGSGADAGDRAGLIRHPGTIFVLLPRAETVP